MTSTRDNYGAWERPVAVFWGNLLAALYCLKNPWRYRVQVENTWIEDRGRRDPHGYTLWVEYVTFVGVVRDNDYRMPVIVKTFFGKSRFLE